MQRLVAPARHGAMKYLTPAEVGQMLSLSPKTISAIALRDASMPATRIGRTLRFEVRAGPISTFTPTFGHVPTGARVAHNRLRYLLTPHHEISFTHSGKPRRHVVLV